jgi:hypothetical protein
MPGTKPMAARINDSCIFVALELLAFCVAAAANARGRNLIGWFFISLLLSPIISLLLLIAFPQAGGGGYNNDQELQRNIALGRSGSGRSVTPGRVIALTFVAAVLLFVGFYSFGRSIWNPDFGTGPFRPPVLVNGPF